MPAWATAERRLTKGDWPVSRPWKASTSETRKVAIFTASMDTPLGAPAALRGLRL
ncbi:hypothetical protein ACRAWD_21785 [Caulobacter segnis]